MVATYKVENGRPVIYLFSRDESQRRVVRTVSGFRPYFYVPCDSEQEPCKKDILGRPIKKVFVNIPTDVIAERRKYPWTCEAKVPFADRFLIDMGIRVGYDWPTLESRHDLGIPPRIMLFDIEVMAPTEIMPKWKTAKWPIVMINLLDTYSMELHMFVVSPVKKWFVLEKRFDFISQVVVHQFPVENDDNRSLIAAERKMLRAWIEHVRSYDYDILSGWYSNGFDIPYIINRCKRLGVPYWLLSPLHKVDMEIKVSKGRETVRPRIQGRVCADLLEWYREFTRPEGHKASWDLKYIVKLESDFEYEDKGDRVEWFWHHNFDALMEYGRDDIVALELIRRRRNIFRAYDTIRRLTGCQFDGIMQAVNIVRANVWRFRKAPLPTPEGGVRGEVKGAFVAKPLEGLIENVAAYDVSSMYPSIIRALNLSPECKDPDGEIEVLLPSGKVLKLKREPKGLMPTVIEYFQELREKYRAEKKKLNPDTREYDIVYSREQSTKYIVNAHWGVYAYSNFDLYDQDIASAIPFTGKRAILFLRKKLAELGYDVAYSDTDSVYVVLKTDDWHEGYKLEPLLKQWLQEFANTMNANFALDIKYEKFYKKIFFKTKKRYAGLMTMKDGNPAHRMDIVGLEFKRSDTALVVREYGKRFFEAVFKEGAEAGAAVVRELIEKFESLPWSQIAIPKGLGKTVYKSKFAWNEGKVISEKLLGLKFHEDQKPRLLYTKAVRGKRIDKICIFDQDRIDGVVVDYKKQLNVAVRRKFEPLLEALGISWSEVESGDFRRQAHLGEWM